MNKMDISKSYAEAVFPQNYLEDVMRYLCDYTNDSLNGFAGLLKESFADISPIFTHKEYAYTFWDCTSTMPGWLAELIIGNACVEMDGGVKLSCLAQQASFHEEANHKLSLHSQDEKRHSHLYIKIAELAFPHLFSQSQRSSIDDDISSIKTNTSTYKTDFNKDILIDAIIQINMIEMRTWTNIKLLTPLIFAFSPEHNRLHIKRLLTSLIKDEVRHISYTAKFIDTWLKNNERNYVESVYKKRLKQFNEMTIKETNIQKHELNKNFGILL